MLIDFYEIAEGNRKNRVLGGGEGVDAERILEPCHENGKAERVEAAIRQHEIFLQRRQNLAVLARHLLHLLLYGYIYRHAAPTVCSSRLGIFAQHLRSSSRSG